MLKCIEVQRLRPGMYIHELCGSWMDHPFWRTSFPLKNANQLQQLRNSSVTAVGEPLAQRTPNSITL